MKAAVWTLEYLKLIHSILDSLTLSQQQDYHISFSKTATPSTTLSFYFTLTDTIYSTTRDLPIPFHICLNQGKQLKLSIPKSIYHSFSLFVSPFIHKTFHVHIFKLYKVEVDEIPCPFWG